jgi:hypothetical protein
MDVTIDLNRLTYRDYRDYLEGRLDEIALLAKVVVRWPFAGNPSEVASYDALGMLDLLAVQKALRLAIQEAAPGN